MKKAVKRRAYYDYVFIGMKKMKKKMYIFPNYLFKKSSKVILYGAGKIGRQLYVQGCRDDYVNIMGIVDSKGEEASWKDEKMGYISVRSIDELHSLDYESILITVSNPILVRDIVYELHRRGVCEDKIIWPESFNRAEEFYGNLNYLFNKAICHFPMIDKGKRTILMLDQAIPKYDYSAGDRHTFQYLILLSKLGFQVIYYSRNNTLLEPYTTELIKSGIKILAGFYWNHISFKKWLKENGDRIDFAYLHRPDVSISYIDEIRNFTHAKIIYYPHDLHFLRWERESNVVHDTLMKNKIDLYKKAEFELIDKSDIVHTVGEFETDYLKRKFPNKIVHEVPIYAYDDAYLEALPPINIIGRKKIMIVGGFGHSPNVDAIDWFIRSIYPNIKAKLSCFNFYIVGSNVPEKILAYQGADVFVTGYVSEAKLKELYAKARVVVAPLRYGAGVKGKVVEALLHGVPLVTTSIGAEGFSNIGECVEICDEPQIFADRVIRLMKDDKLWLKLAISGRKYIYERFNSRNAENILLKDFS